MNVIRGNRFQSPPSPSQSPPPLIFREAKKFFGGASIYVRPFFFYKEFWVASQSPPLLFWQKFRKGGGLLETISSDIGASRNFYLDNWAISRLCGHPEPITFEFLAIFRGDFGLFSPKFHKKLNCEILCLLYCPQIFYRIKDI